jgi:hypothetical protein
MVFDADFTVFVMDGWALLHVHNFRANGEENVEEKGLSD